MQYFVQMIIRWPVMTTTLVGIFVLGLANVPLTAKPPKPQSPWAPQAQEVETIADAQDIHEQTWQDRLALLVDPVVATARSLTSLTPQLRPQAAVTAAAVRGRAVSAAAASARPAEGHRKESLVLKAQPG